MSSLRRRRAAVPSGPTRAFVDSGAWLAFFSASDQHHAAADALFRRAGAEGARLLTTNLVLAEVHRLLLFRAGPAPAAAALERIDASAMIRVIFAEEALHRRAREWLAKLPDQKISYTDASSFAVMEKEGCRAAITFDRHFWLAGFQMLQP
jgi:predicted nucleic acid-binding protein